MKNTKPIGGRPLCAWVLRAAVDCPRIDAVYVSTDCPRIRDTVHALDLGVQVVERPAKYATDAASTESVMLHFIKQVTCEHLVTIQATSPLLESDHLQQALAQFDREGDDSMLSAVRTRRFFWSLDAKPLNYDPLLRPRRQDFDGLLMENGAFYITKTQALESSRCRLSGRIGIYEMPESTAVEIDEPADWDVVSRLLLSRS